MNQLQQLLMQMSNVGSGMPLGDDFKEPDSSEQLTISSLALLKMLKHARAGVPMEVMGLMLGSFVDDYTIRVVDVFAMPQSGTGVSVEAVDPVFQTRMMDLLKMTGRGEQVVGWYHSHPGFGCWLSNVDVNTQKSFEQLHERAVAVVVDPIQSVKGKVVIDTFRTIDPTRIVFGEPRQTTSMLGHLHPQSLVALMHGLNRHYYSLGINYRKTPLEEKMLLNLHKSEWKEGLRMKSFLKHAIEMEENVKMMRNLSKTYNNALIDEEKLSEKQLLLRNVGKLDPKRRLEELSEDCIEDNIVCLLGESMALIGTKGIRKVIVEESIVQSKKSALLQPPKAVRIRSLAKTAKSFWPKELKSPLTRKHKRQTTPLFNPESTFRKKSRDYLDKMNKKSFGSAKNTNQDREYSQTKNLHAAGLLKKNYLEFSDSRRTHTKKQSQNHLITKFMNFRKSMKESRKTRRGKSLSGVRQSKSSLEVEANGARRLSQSKSEIQKTVLDDILSQLKTVSKTSKSDPKNKKKHKSKIDQNEPQK